MSRAVQSHVGSMPIYVAPEVNVSIGPMSVAKTIRKGRGLLSLAQVISVEGPKGTLKLEVPDFISMEKDKDSGKVTISVKDNESKLQKSMWGQ